MSANKKFENEKDHQKIKSCENWLVFHQAAEKISQLRIEFTLEH